MELYVKVDRDTCIGCGECGAVAPDIFDYDERGISFSLLDFNEGTMPVSEDLVDDLEDACDSCPTNSIKVEEEPFVASLKDEVV
ncbi:ferredoxin [Peribacillus frigoritolerans]|uniref:ferredoxin n=1 Tax=Peribacillus frigoritolerans TaxID=450367 RepID=UPI0032E50952